MKIEAAILRGQSALIGIGGPGASSTAPPATHPRCDEQHCAQDVPLRRPALLRGTLSSLRYQTLQNAPVARANTAPPGQDSTDSQLAGELRENFGELHAFLKQGRLTQSSLRQLAAQKLEGEHCA